mgnify:FL=1|tara:strand:- start:4567 stop:5115 length:549 start_codon:yes stop_codon:yes gene_type:complete
MTKIVAHRKRADQELLITDNTFTTEEYEKILDYVKYASENSPRVVNDDWPEDLIKDVEGYTRFIVLCDEEIVNPIINKCAELFGTSKNPSDYGIMYYEGESKFGLNWHKDSGHSSSASIYLNDDWQDDYGGYFVCRMDGATLTTAIKPDLGMSVFQRGKILHGVTATRHDAPIRKSIQVFIR